MHITVYVTHYQAAILHKDSRPELCVLQQKKRAAVTGKPHLRVDSSDEDALIGILLSSAEQMCKDVGRLSEDQWEAVNAADRDAENGVQPTRELEALRSTCRVAILYALGYLYEHRDEADHHQLMLTLRSILFAVREGVF